MDQARQQVIETIKGHNNVLVTVSASPSVDELSAAIGLTLLLDKLEKRSATIFSGAVPPAISFLEPEKTFENSPDSLRDFIIALDKEKADHLRYKVEGESVKIFITPYRTTLSQDDLEFSQGDYNVELVIALGVKDQAHLDKALESHGKILHDSTVVTATAGKEGGSNLGSLNWHNQSASSLCEMIATLADGLKGDKKTLLDQQISTALLTGVVSSTDRFSNDHTSANTMTIAAQLMAAGANQQLIAAKLEEAHDIPASGGASAQSNSANDSSTPTPVDNGTELSIDRSEKAEKTIEPPQDPQQDAPAESPVTQEAEPEKEPEVQQAPEASQPDVESAEPNSQVPPVETDLQQTQPAPESAQPAPQPKQQPKELTDQLELEKQLAGITAPKSTQPPVTESELNSAANEPANAPTSEPKPPADGVAMPDFEASAMPQGEAPSMPVPPPDLSAPPQSQEIINNHGPAGAPAMGLPPLNSIQSGPASDESPTVDPFAGPPAPSAETPPATQQQAPASASESTAQPTTPGGGTPEGAAMLGGEMPQASVPQQSGLPQLPPLPPLPSETNIPLPPPPPPPSTQMAPPAPAMPSGAVSGDVFGDAGAPPAQAPPAESPAPEPQPAPGPGQFRIPGQPS